MANTLTLKVKKIVKSFNKIQALKGVTMEFGNEHMHGIIGPEGAGKTTLLRIILSLLKPETGTVEFAINDRLVAYEDMRSDIAYMPQSQSLYPDLSIGEHLDFFKELYGISQKDYTLKRAELLKITRLEDFVDRPAGKLSGGMYKKLGLICALLRSPKIMLLDEPTNGVDPISRREFWELLYRLSDQKILILMTTSYMDEAERCGCVHLLSSGLVVAEGDPRELLEKERVKSFDELFLREGHHD